MVFLISVVAGCAIVLAGASTLLKIAVSLVEESVGRSRARFARALARVAIFLLVVCVSLPIVFVIVPGMPDFRKPGDGGVGMAWNVVSKVAVCVLAPTTVFSWLLGYLRIAMPPPFDQDEFEN